MRRHIKSSVVPTGTMQFTEGTSRPNVIVFVGEIITSDIVIGDNGFTAISGKTADGVEYPTPALNDAGETLPIESHKAAQEAGLLYVLTSELAHIPAKGKLVLKKTRNRKGYVNYIVDLDA